MDNSLSPSEAWTEHYKHSEVNIKLVVKWILKNHPWSGSRSFSDKIIKYGKINNKSKIFEPGCATAKISLAVALRANCEITCLDYSEEALTVARETYNTLTRVKPVKINAKFVIGDLQNLKFNNEFDVVFNEGVIEHWFDKNDRLNTIINMAKACKPGGKVLIWVPNAMSFFYKFWIKTKYPAFDIVSEKPFRPDELKELMKLAGLKDVKVEIHQIYLSPFIWPYIFTKFRVLAVFVWFVFYIMPKSIHNKLSFKFGHQLLGMGTKQ